MQPREALASYRRPSPLRVMNMSGLRYRDDNSTAVQLSERRMNTTASTLHVLRSRDPEQETVPQIS